MSAVLWALDWRFILGLVVGGCVTCATLTHATLAADRRRRALVRSHNPFSRE